MDRMPRSSAFVASMYVCKPANGIVVSARCAHAEIVRISFTQPVQWAAWPHECSLLASCKWLMRRETSLCRFVEPPAATIRAPVLKAAHSKSDH